MALLKECVLKKNRIFRVLVLVLCAIVAAVLWYGRDGYCPSTLRRAQNLRNELAGATNDIMRGQIVEELVGCRERLVQCGHIVRKSIPVELKYSPSGYQKKFYAPLTAYEKHRSEVCAAVCFVPQVESRGFNDVHVSAVVIWDEPDAISGWQKLIRTLSEAKGALGQD